MLASSGQEAVLDTYAGTYPTGCVVSIQAAGNSADITYIWTKAGSGSLLIHALPHHIDALVSPTTVSYGLDTLKGQTTGVVGTTWVVREALPTITFAPPRALASGRVAAVQTALTADVAGSYGSSLGDPYFGTKNLGKWARIAQIADELGDTTSARTARTKMRADIKTWLDGANANRLRYDTTWRGVCTENSLNDLGADFTAGRYSDHHYHYGYLIYAAAVLAKGDPAFLTDYGHKVNELVREIANPSRSDTYATRFRHKDWYHGHSWAQGLDGSADPKNQESTSEAINAYYAVMLWGLVSGSALTTAVGQVLMATEVRSAAKYWHMPSASTVYPEPFKSNKVVGILWGSKIDYVTFFGGQDEYIHGIQVIPVTPATEKYLEKPWATEDFALLDTRVLERSSPTRLDLVSGGTGYPQNANAFTNGDGSQSYVNNGLTVSGGHGTGLVINANIHAATGALYEVFIAQGGTGYQDGDVVTVEGTSGTKAQLRLIVRVEEGWEGFIRSLQAVSDKDAAWARVTQMTSFDGGTSKASLLHWIASRP